MSKKTKEIIFYVIAFVGFFVVPNVLFGHFSLRDQEIFYKHLNEDKEACYRHAREDSRDPKWCSEVYEAARLAYTQADSSNNSQMILLMFQPILFVLFVSLYNLRKQFEELKNKVDV